MIDYNKIATKYALHREIHPEVMKNLIVVGKIGVDTRVLEVGCGTGNYIIALQSISGCFCHGIDPSRGMLSIAAERLETIDFRQGNVRNMDFPDDFFDLVFSVDVIHHINDCPEYFWKANRILRKGGKVCAVTDSEWIIRNRRPLAVYFPDTVEVDIERYPRISELREMMSNAGFEGIKENIVEFSYQLNNIQAYQDKSFSSLHLISKESFEKGIVLMKRDLNKGPISCISRYLTLWGFK